jgi:hypothetical protein
MHIFFVNLLKEIYILSLIHIAARQPPRTMPVRIAWPSARFASLSTAWSRLIHICMPKLAFKKHITCLSIIPFATQKNKKKRRKERSLELLAQKERKGKAHKGKQEKACLLEIAV